MPANGEESDEAPLKPFPVPEWLQTTHQRLVFNADPDVTWAEQGVRIICPGTDASAFPFLWDGKDRVYNQETGGDVDLEKYKAYADRAHKLGLKVLCPLPRMWHPDKLLVEHPEWQELSRPDAKPKGPEDQLDAATNGCWISPFGDFYIRQCVEFARRFHWDGFNLHGFGMSTVCYCAFCRESYLQEEGTQLPKKKDLHDLAYRRFLKWKSKRWTEFVYKWQKAVKEVNPEFAAIPWSHAPGLWRYWTTSRAMEGSDAANRIVDAPILKLSWDFKPDQGSNLLPSFLIRFYRGLTAERPVFILPSLGSQSLDHSLAPAVERDFRVLTVMANGAYCAQGSWQLGNGVPVQHYMDLIKVREPYTTKAESLKWAALLVSESSRLFYGLPGAPSESPVGSIGSGQEVAELSTIPPNERRLPAHLESALGVFRAALEDHLPLDVVTEQDVEEGTRLKLYKVLVLPNAACFSDTALENIRSFVDAGGGLVAAHESSLYDQYGTRRPDFGLADLYQATFLGVKDHAPKWPQYGDTTTVALGSHFITEDPVIEGGYRGPERTLDFIGVTVEVKLSNGGQVVAYHGTNAAGARDQSRLTEGAHPFLIVSSPKERSGRVVYFPNDIGQSYFVSPYQYYRKLITRAIRWAAGKASPRVTVTAPMCVQAAFYRQGERRTVVHLLNEVNSTGGRALPEGDSPMREEVVPVSGIEVTFDEPNIKRVHLVPEGIDLNVSRKGGVAHVKVPPLQLHSMVVAEK